jgi:serine/threonine protein kinase
VWSFGILLWQMVYLEEPYNNLDAVSSAIEVTKGLRPQITNSCPPVLASLIKSCLSTKPSARPTFRMIHDHLDLYQKRLDDRNWYYPSMDRQHAEALLSKFNQDSSVFLIRKSPDGQTLTLSRYNKEKVQHDRITPKGGRFQLDGSNFAYCSLYDIAACQNFEPIGFVTNYSTSFKIP